MINSQFQIEKEGYLLEYRFCMSDDVMSDCVGGDYVIKMGKLVVPILKKG